MKFFISITMLFLMGMPCFAEDRRLPEPDPEELRKLIGDYDKKSVDISADTTEMEETVAEEEAQKEEKTEEIKETQVKEEVKKKKTAARQGDKVHKVWLWQESRDCLWNLAEKYYGDPWLWKEIYLANQDTIKDPRVIYPKQKIIIPQLEGGKE
jgi:nucleoid-associated protein YgaU